MSQLTKRKPAPLANENGATANGESGKIKNHNSINGFLTKKHWISYVLISFLIYYLCFQMDGWLPTPLTDVEAGLDKFSEIRAMKHLNILSDYGPKPSGSYAAEVLTRNYIVDEVTKIKSDMNVNNHNIEIGVQKPNGCFDFSFLSGFMLCYKNVTNIVVVLSPKTLTDHSILVNCHFDSVPASPGATDDLASCVIMLEIMSILSKSSSSLTHNVIFLFNGAEENFMQGAHGFITQHRLRHTIKAFINLEGAGAGGREFLFQSGPSNMWLLHAYLDSAKYPHGSVMAQEIFESGVILSDTDYRVFRDYGRLSGLDIAYVKNGYLYHTEFDKASFIPAGSLQRAGENVLATLKTLAHSPCLARPCPSSDDKIIFFDILGMFVVQYSMKVGVFLNFLTVFFVFIKVYGQFRSAERSKNEFKDKQPSNVDGYTVGDFVRQLITHVLSLICIIVSAIFLTKIVEFIDLTLCWYSQPLLMLPLYMVPLIFVGYTVHLLVPKFISCLTINDAFRREQVTFDVSLSVMALLLFVLTLLGIRSAYFLMAITIFPIIRDPLRSVFVRFGFDRRNANLLYFCHLLTSIPGSFLGAYAFVEVTTFFIPMMGRSCSKLNPEHFVAGLCAMSAVFIVLFTVSLVHVSRDLAYLMKCTVALILLITIILALTPFGSPYKFDPDGPRWRRLHIQHVRRRTILENSQKTDENGVWILSLDYRGVQDLPSHTFLQGSKPPGCIDEDEFCGLPYYLPLRGVIPADSTLWLSVPNPPTFTKPLSLKLLSKDKIASDKFNFTFSIDGTDHITMTVSPSKSWHLDTWSFDNNPLDEQKTYFVYLANVNVKEPWTFSIVLQTDDESLMNRDSKKLLLAVATHELHGEHQYSETLKTIVRTVRQRRSEPELTKGHWKWAMTVDGWGSDYLVQHFG